MQSFKAAVGDDLYTLVKKGLGSSSTYLLIKGTAVDPAEEVWDIAPVSGLFKVVENQVLNDSLDHGAIAVMPQTRS